MREPTKNDYTEDELLNLKNGNCWCGKPRKEFDKGMRIYCCKNHREDWYYRTAYWSTVRAIYLEKNGEKCKKCGLDKEMMDKDLKKQVIDWKKNILADPKSKFLLDEERIRKLRNIETDYERAMDDEHIFDSVFDVYYQVDNFERKPDKYHKSLTFEVDHKIAVALGGDQWDEKNLQVLCTTCHKEKTAIDMKKLKAKRRKLVRFDD